jgi:hypothetical protein
VAHRVRIKVVELLLTLYPVLCRNIPSCQLSLKYDVMPYVGIVTPGVGARARNPTWTNGTKASSTKTLGEWDIAVPGVKSGGVGS